MANYFGREVGGSRTVHFSSLSSRKEKGSSHTLSSKRYIKAFESQVFNWMSDVSGPFRGQTKLETALLAKWFVIDSVACRSVPVRCNVDSVGLLVEKSRRGSTPYTSSLGPGSSLHIDSIGVRKSPSWSPSMLWMDFQTNWKIYLLIWYHIWSLFWKSSPDFIWNHLVLSIFQNTPHIQGQIKRFILSSTSMTFPMEFTEYRSHSLTWRRQRLQLPHLCLALRI